MSRPVSRFLEFGPFRLDRSKRLLLLNGQTVSIEPKVLHTLLVLVESKGELVTKNHLMAQVWPDTFVQEDGLTRNISMLRKILASGLQETPCVETFPKVGYRFVVPVREIEELPAEAGQALGVSSPEEQTPRGSGISQAEPGVLDHPAIPEPEAPRSIARLISGRRNLLVLGLCGLALIGAAAFFRLHRTISGTSVSAARRSIAVLAFRNLSGSAEAEWLVTAAPEWLTTELGAGREIRVVPRTDVASVETELLPNNGDTLTRAALKRIRSTLGTDLVVFGSFAAANQGPEGQIHVDVRVFETSTGETIASLSETGSELAIFELISRSGAALRQKLGVPSLAPAEVEQVRSSLPSSSQAAELYTQGLARLRSYDALAAKDLFLRVIDAEPDYPLAHSALADAWSALGYEAKAKEEASRALELAGSLPQEQRRLLEARYSETAKDWNKAIDIYRALWTVFPDDPEYGLRLATAQTAARRGREALATIEELRRLRSPVSSDPRIDLAEAQAAEALGDLKREQMLAAQAAAKAKALGARSITARALLSESWALDNLGEFNPAIQAANEAKQVFASVGDKAGVARALKNVGDVLTDQGDFAKAKATYEEALPICRAIGYKTGEAVVLNNMAFDFKNEGDLEGAQRTYTASIAISREVGDRGREANALNGMAIILWRRGDLEGALKVYQEAFQSHVEAGDRGRAATVLGNIAIVLQDQGRLAEADKKYAEALQINRELGIQPEVARLLENIGELRFRQGDLSGAEKHFDEAAAVSGRIDFKRIKASAAGGLGDVFAARGDLKRARERYEEALKLRTEMNEKSAVAETKLGIARLDLDQDRLEEALTNARQAAAEFQSEKEGEEEAGATIVMADCLLRQGKSSEAQSAMDRVRELAPKIEDRDIRLFVAITAALLAGLSGSASDAVKDLRANLAEAKRFGYLGYEFQARLALGEIAVKSGKINENHADLTALQAGAKAKGFGSIVNKAASIIADVEHQASCK
jgi:tetratricopeptide (TPR) repeat protein/DNA-binding winged helix-turn-helix (wHTH) protein/TolB-like protein